MTFSFLTFVSVIKKNKIFLPQMYPYHNKIKERIRNGELVGYEYVEKYRTISPCLLLYFSTEPKIKPIREHRFKEYEEFLANFGKK